VTEKIREKVQPVLEKYKSEIGEDIVNQVNEELEKIRSEIGDDEWFEREGRPGLSRRLFEQVALSGDEFVEFLTLPAYEELLRLEAA